MKNTLIAVFIATSVALGAICVVQWQKLSGQKIQTAILRAELEQKAQEITELQVSQKLLDQQRRKFLDQAGDLAQKLQAQRQTDAKAAKRSTPDAATESDDKKTDKGGFGNFLAKMMEDPDTKKLIREQQRMMLDQLYSPLIKQMDLTPEEATQFKDLLADNMMKAAEKATSFLGGGSSTNRSQMLSAVAEEQKNFDEQLRGFLGETRYAEYKEYQQTVGERTQLNLYQQQNAGGASALTEQQTEQLLGFMQEEKRAVTSANGLPLPGENQDPASLQAMFSGEGTEKLLQSQETINQRVYDRAKGTLSENQLGAFGKFQTNQLQMMRMGMNMARKFMTPEKTEGAPPPPSNP